ncbi:DUF4919 domain-containing protein [Lacinutrix chionoecetis]
MMKYFFITLFLVAGLNSFGQDEIEFKAPDYKKIEKTISKKKSDLFYKKLMKRFLDADSTMSLVEKRHLYYGFTFNEKYSPYSRSEFTDSLRTILNKPKLEETDFKNIIKFSNEIFKENPFDIRTYNYVMYAYDELGNKPELEKAIIKVNMIVDALLSSGDGISKKTAFYVIYTTHEYDLISILGFKFGGMQSLIEHYDRLTLAENEYGFESFYFDVSPCLNSMSKMFKN